jgi:putative NADPH-quinone reductase
MSRRIVIIQGHPDPEPRHYGHALAAAYAEGARAGGHEVRTINVATLQFPMLRKAEDFNEAKPPQDILRCQEAVRWADHLVILYPLWLGTMPALLKAFMEQLFRPGFAVSQVEEGMKWQKLLKGRSARIVVTMGMPAFVYRWFFRAHSLKSLERNILGFVGIKPVKETLIGTVEAKPAKRHQWLDKMHYLGKTGQ